MSLVIQHDISLKPFNTFGMAVRARHFCRLTAAEQLPELLRLAEYRNGPVLWLGGGSNVLFTRDFDGLVVKLDNKGINQLEADADHVIAQVRHESGQRGAAVRVIGEGGHEKRASMLSAIRSPTASWAM